MKKEENGSRIQTNKPTNKTVHSKCFVVTVVVVVVTVVVVVVFLSR